MKVLHLTLKKKWFDMIASGEKKEEYRECKPYWNKRLSGHHYTHILFVNGYGKGRPRVLVELRSISKGLGLTKWGAPAGKPVYVIVLGKILNDQIEYQI